MPGLLGGSCRRDDQGESRPQSDTMSKRVRTGRIFIDYLRDGGGGLF